MTHLSQTVSVTSVILCGGSGTRLWPVSRQRFPKQFHSFGGKNSLLQESIQRAAGFTGMEQLLLVTGEDTAALAQSQAEAVYKGNTQLLIEPEGRNTAAALAAAALHAERHNSPDSVIVAMPADHKIDDMVAFQRAIDQATQAAADGWVVTLGITPTGPETGYGYITPGEEIEKSGGAFRAIVNFVEKPSQTKAQLLIEEASALWNCGIFIARADKIISKMALYEPEILEAVRHGYEKGEARPQGLLLSRDFLKADSQPFDKAVMERTQDGLILPVQFGWSDVGNWSAIAEHHAIPSNEEAVLIDCEDAYVDSRSNRLVAGLGVKNLVIIDTPDALLVADRNHAQDVGQLSKMLSKQKPTIVKDPAKVARPWGNYQSVHQGHHHQVKHIEVAPAGRLSLQRHRHRAEHWVIVSGTAEVTVDGVTRTLEANEHVFIPQGAVHRLENHGEVPVHLIEVQFGAYLGEDDIIRLHDVYGRTEQPLTSANADEADENAVA